MGKKVSFTIRISAVVMNNNQSMKVVYIRQKILLSVLTLSISLGVCSFPSGHRYWELSFIWIYKDIIHRYCGLFLYLIKIHIFTQGFSPEHWSFSACELLIRMMFYGTFWFFRGYRKGFAAQKCIQREGIGTVDLLLEIVFQIT